LEQPERRREDEWFLRNEEKLIEKARQEREKRELERLEKETAAHREQLRALHYLKCPKCGHDMVEQDYSGVTVERCSFCEGLFFDAHELEDLMLKRQEERRSLVRRLLGL